MKKLNLILGVFLGMIIISCSSDDNDNTEPQISQLIKVEQRAYYNEILEEKIIFDYNNQRLEMISFYNENDILAGSSDFIYNSQGILIGINDFSADNSQTRELTISYDTLNRIIQTDRVYLSDLDNHITTNFTHNSDNTINSLYSYLGNNQERIFEINSNGIIDKEIFDGNVVVSVEYNNLNPITKTTSSAVYNYSYIENGVMPFSFQNTFGNNPINVVLFQNSLDDSSNSLATDLIASITSSLSTKEYVYTLNDDNFPLTRKDFYNGELDNELDYFYE